MAYFNFCFWDLCPTHVSQPGDTYCKHPWPEQMAANPKMPNGPIRTVQEENGSRQMRGYRVQEKINNAIAGWKRAMERLATVLTLDCSLAGSPGSRSFAVGLPGRPGQPGHGPPR